MFAEAEPIYRPESFDENREEKSPYTRRRIVHLRHRIGDYDVTRLILDSTVEAKAADT